MDDLPILAYIAVLEMELEMPSHDPGSGLQRLGAVLWVDQV